MDSVLKLILVVCRKGRRGWIWIEVSMLCLQELAKDNVMISALW